ILLLGNERHRPVEPDRENILETLEIGEGALMLDEGAVAPEPGENGLSGFGMAADLAWQGQKLEREIEIHIVRRNTPRQRGAGWLFAILALAALDVRPEAAVLQGDRQSGFRIIAENLALSRDGAAFLAIGRGTELAGVAALGIVRAADEGSEL